MESKKGNIGHRKRIKGLGFLHVILSPKSCNGTSAYIPRLEESIQSVVLLPQQKSSIHLNFLIVKSEFVGFLCTAKFYVHTSAKKRMSSTLWLFSQRIWNLHMLLKVKSLEIRYILTWKMLLSIWSIVLPKNPKNFSLIWFWKIQKYECLWSFDKILTF